MITPRACSQVKVCPAVSRARSEDKEDFRLQVSQTLRRDSQYSHLVYSCTYLRDSSSCSVVFFLSWQPYLERLLMDSRVGTTRRRPTCEEVLVIILMERIMIKDNG